MIAGAEPQEKSAPLIVSWSSLEKRRAEHEEIVKVKIPENTKEIAIARSYGDLSENFEFKAAKQMQSVLMRRKAELEQMLHDARGTSFENPDTSRVSIGTIVTLRSVEGNNEETYTILGAWDGDPDRHIISYQTAIGQALLGHEVGETISLNRDESVAQFTIISIEPAPPDQTATRIMRAQAALLASAAAQVAPLRAMADSRPPQFRLDSCRSTGRLPGGVRRVLRRATRLDAFSGCRTGARRIRFVAECASRGRSSAGQR